MAETTQVVSDVLRLNIGGGETQIPGFINIDRKDGKEAYPLDFPDESVDEIRASHILEHFPQSQEQEVVNEWVRVLKPGGRIRIAVPDAEKLAEMLLGKRNSPINPMRFVYGGQTDENDYHKNGFNYGGLHVLLQRAGLIAIDTWKSDQNGEAAHMPISLNLEGYKPTKGFRELVQKCHVAMSMPRLWFADTARCIEGTINRMGVPAKLGTGAFWGQCLERNMTEIVKESEENGREFILTIDYDTAFTQNELAKMLMLMDRHPEIDALAPLQPKRNDGTPLINKDGALSKDEAIGPLIPATMAHFGLTLIRISALKKMPHPWFVGQPNKDGEWGDGRVDDDVYFWNKFKECGNKLFVASRVSVGHIQLVATWTTEGFGTFHQYLNDFHDNGPPEERRH
jgi:hypothetical protein